MITGFAKKIVPQKIKAYIKMGKERKDFSKLISIIEKNDSEFDILLGTAIHKNLGDHLITLAEKQLLNDINPERRLFEIPSEVFQYYHRRLSLAIKPSTRIFINGGGWMGNLWPNEEKLLQDMVNMFKHNKIVIFPQTIFYDKSVMPYKELINRGNLVYKQCKDLTLFVRDQQSFEFSKKFLNIKKVILVPDVALYYSFKCNTKKTANIIGLCIREDREKSTDSEEIKSLCKELTVRGFQLKKLSTMNFHRLPTTKRKEVVEERLSEFSKCSVIITDRLHGMIFSYIAGTPCIAFDNRTKKVSGVYKKWLSECETIYPCFTKINIKKVAEFIQKKQGKTSSLLNLKKSFEPLKQEVIYGGD